MNLKTTEILFNNLDWHLENRPGDLAVLDYYQKAAAVFLGKVPFKRSDQIETVAIEDCFNKFCEVGAEGVDTPFRVAYIKELMSKTHGWVNRQYWLFTEQVPALDVLFISHDASTRGHIYRVYHVCEALKKRGVNAAWIELHDLKYLISVLSKIKRLVIFRCEASQHLGEFIQDCQQRGVWVTYDIDDFIFDRSVIENSEVDFIARLDNASQRDWLVRIDRYDQAMSMANSVTVPTTALKEQVILAGHKCIVFPNTFDLTMQEMSKYALCNETTKKVIIGYASGTPTHEEDFATVSPTMLELMERYPELELRIIGYLKCIEGVEFDRFRERIIVRPVVEHSHLPIELAKFDINIIPLERNRFTDSKSELKFFESALLSIPSVVTENSVYRQVIIDGENGYLICERREWFTVLSSLIDSVKLRRRIGRQAYRDATEHYDVNKLIDRYRQDVIIF